MLDRRYGFDTIQKDTSNAQAVDACRCMCEEAQTKGVLWVFGPTGCGKTHLLKAMKNTLLYSEQQSTVVYANARELTEVLVDFIGGGTDIWIRLQQADALLIDNVEYLLGRTQTQHTFADLILKMCADGKRVVLASLCSPQQLEGLWQGLSAQTDMLSAVEIQPPCKETKTEIARIFLQEHVFDMPQNILDALIDGASNVLQLNGALYSAWLYTRAGGHIDETWLQTCIRNFW